MSKPSLPNEKECGQCEILNEMLRLVNLRYEKLQCENYAGELTISCLKGKN